jgi:phosphoribosylformylglycinamidine synthase PurS subunit
VHVKELACFHWQSSRCWHRSVAVRAQVSTSAIAGLVTDSSAAIVPANGWRLLQWDFMKARVYVSMKPTVLDPQGATIRSALAGLGHTSIAAVRQGKYFEITLEPGTDRVEANMEIDQIARDVLANPVIEEYRVEFVD